MAQNHYCSKNKRRPKNSNRVDYTADTMAKLKQLKADAAKREATLLAEIFGGEKCHPSETSQ